MTILRSISELLIGMGISISLIFLAGVAGNGFTSRAAILIFCLIMAGCSLCIFVGLYLMSYVEWKEAEADRIRHCLRKYGHTYDRNGKSR